MTEKKRTLLFNVLTDLCGMVDEIKNGFFSGNVKYLFSARTLGVNVLAKLDSEVAAQSAGEVSGNNMEMLSITARVDDLLLSIITDMETKVRRKIFFSTKAVLEMSYLLRELRSLLEITADFVNLSDQLLFELFKERQSSLEQLRKNFISDHETRLLNGVCLTDGSTIYLNILESISSITMKLTQLVFMAPVVL